MTTVVTDRKTKNIKLVVAGADLDEVRELTITPGTTVKELLETTGLEGYQVSVGRGQGFLKLDDDVHQLLADGGTLYASTSAEAGMSK